MRTTTLLPLAMTAWLMAADPALARPPFICGDEWVSFRPDGSTTTVTVRKSDILKVYENKDGIGTMFLRQWRASGDVGRDLLPMVDPDALQLRVCLVGAEAYRSAYTRVIKKWLDTSKNKDGENAPAHPVPN